MDIRNPKRLKKVAAHRLENARDAGRILLIYGGILAVSSLLVTGFNSILSSQISQTGGLGNMGTRSILSTFQTILPILQSVVMLCVEFGYMAAMLRIARNQYASPMSMKMGLERAWVLIRTMLVQSAIYCCACLAGLYLASMIFSFTPLSNAATELLTPLLAQASDPEALIAAMDEATQLQLLQASIPLFVLCLVCCVALMIPISYRYRMVYYVLMDKPSYGAMKALRESKAMMRGNKLALFKMDLGYWWYYGLIALTAVLCYGDVILALLDISQPFSSTVSYYLFYVLSLAAQLGVYWFFRNRVEVSYALAYESIRPKEEPEGGAVLGNIFQM
ncbi:MAG: DUF975 family protein [Oscillospiraceae bacterium]|nr:DUF975 family protein [Oscillospiraceae bacterium]